MEKTVVTSVNNTHSKFSPGSQSSAGSSNSTSGSSTKASASREDTVGVKTNTGKYGVVNEGGDNTIIVNTSEMEKIDIHHHSKTTRSEGSSLQEIEITQTRLLARDSVDDGENNPSEITYSPVGFANRDQSNGSGKQTTIIEEIYVVNSENIQTPHETEDNKKQSTEVLHRRRGELRDTENQQNDGAYKSKCASNCRNQTKDTNTPQPDKAKTTEGFQYVYHEDDDEGIIKLRKILQEAQETIQKFQMDFQIDGNFTTGNVSRSWPISEDGIKAPHYNVTSGKLGNGNCGSGNSAAAAAAAGSSRQSTFYEARGRSSTVAHPVRHQHHKDVRKSRKGGGRRRERTRNRLSGSLDEMSLTSASAKSMLSVSSTQSASKSDEHRESSKKTLPGPQEQGQLQETSVDTPNDTSTTVIHTDVKTTTNTHARRKQNKKRKKTRKNNETSTVSSVTEDNHTKESWTE